MRYREKHQQLLAKFKNYLWRVPVYGTIMLDPTATQVLLVKAWKGKSWSFPKGKINEAEEPIDCAAREAEEETGYNARRLLRKRGFITHQDGDRKVTLYIGIGVPMDFPFAPQTRKEISEVKWFDLASIPTAAGGKGASRFWSCRPFIRSLKAYLAAAAVGKVIGPFYIGPSSKKGAKGKSSTGKGKGKSTPSAGAGHGGSGGGGGGGGGGAIGDAHNSVTFGSEMGSSWDVTDMFATNERLLGVRFTYDGNSNDFGSASAAAVPVAPSERMPGPPGTPLLHSVGGSAAAMAAIPPVSQIKRQVTVRRPAAGSGSGFGPAASVEETFGTDLGTSWGVEEMFATNERMLGVKFTYDGNAQDFGDPHAAARRTGRTAAAPPPPRSSAPSPPSAPYFGTFAFNRQRLHAIFDTEFDMRFGAPRA